MVHRWYPPETAEDWDAVGLAAGDPDAHVRRILLAVDPVLPTAEEAAARDALHAAGAGHVGDYDTVSYTVAGEGRFRPLPGAHPAVGEVGRLEVTDELRIEALVPRHRRTQVIRAVLAAHPYEEVAYDV